MKVSLKQLLESQEPLAWLVAQKVRPKTAFTLSKVTRLVSHELAEFEQVRLQTLQRLGTLNEEKMEYEFPTPESQTEWGREYAELLTTEVDLAVNHVLLEDLRDAAISARDLILLEWLIELPEDDAPKAKE